MKKKLPKVPTVFSLAVAWTHVLLVVHPISNSASFLQIH